MLLDSTFHFQTLEVPVVPIPDLRDLYLYSYSSRDWRSYSNAGRAHHIISIFRCASMEVSTCLHGSKIGSRFTSMEVSENFNGRRWRLPLSA